MIDNYIKRYNYQNMRDDSYCHNCISFFDYKIVLDNEVKCTDHFICYECSHKTDTDDRCSRCDIQHISSIYIVMILLCSDQTCDIEYLTKDIVKSLPKNTLVLTGKTKTDRKIQTLCRKMGIYTSSVRKSRVKNMIQYIDRLCILHNNQSDKFYTDIEKLSRELYVETLLYSIPI